MTDTQEAPEQIWLTTTESGKVDEFTMWTSDKPHPMNKGAVEYRRATPEADTPAVRVKALVWEDDMGPSSRARTVKGWRAWTILHFPYEIKIGRTFRVIYGVTEIARHSTAEAAKAAAQADYEARILSALEPAPVQGWGDGCAAEVMLRHYANEVRPHAEAQGDDRADVKAAVLAKVARVFDEAWTAPQEDA